MIRKPPEDTSSRVEWLLGQEKRYEKSERWDDAVDKMARDLGGFLVEAQVPHGHPVRDQLCYFAVETLKLGYLMGRTDAYVLRFVDLVDFEQEEIPMAVETKQERTQVEGGPSPQSQAVHCFRCGRRLTNPISVALGIGPICRTMRNGGGGFAGGPGYPNKDAADGIPPGFSHTEGLCGCAITSIPPELLGVTFAKECLRYCCQHCPSRGDRFCPAEKLREEGKLRAYATSGSRFCLGYWVEREYEKERLWAVFYDNDDSLIEPNLLWKTRPLVELDGSPGMGMVSLGNPRSLLEAQIMTLQKTPLKA